MTLDASLADAAPTRRSSRAAAPAVQAELTRAQWRRLQAQAVEAQVEVPQVEAVQVSSQHTEPTNGPITAIAETRDAAPASVSAPTLRRRDRAHAKPGVSAFALADTLPAEEVVATAEDAAAESVLIDAHAADAIPLAFVAAAAEPCLADEFEQAARLLSFTGQTPIQTVPVVAAPVPAAHVVRRHRRVSFKRVAATSFSLGVMSLVGLLAIGTTLPASAISATPPSADIAVAAPEPKATENIQAYVSSTDGDSTLERSSSFDVESMEDIAADSGVTQFAGTWVSDPSAAIQWPFPVGVPISAAYGSQTYLSKFSSPHRGVDLTPGTGAEVHVIADGTVRIATEAGGDYGVTVVVDHVIDGRLVSTRYAHMQYGSLQVSQGDTVSVGDVIGRVGQTGKATGPHLHFEVLLDGTTHTDPIAWMEQHTDG